MTASGHVGSARSTTYAQDQTIRERWNETSWCKIRIYTISHTMEDFERETCHQTSRGMQNTMATTMYCLTDESESTKRAAVVQKSDATLLQAEGYAFIHCPNHPTIRQGSRYLQHILTVYPLCLGGGRALSKRKLVDC